MVAVVQARDVSVVAWNGIRKAGKDEETRRVKKEMCVNHKWTRAYTANPTPFT